jgi:hypothetical protein
MLIPSGKRLQKTMERSTILFIFHGKTHYFYGHFNHSYVAFPEGISFHEDSPEKITSQSSMSSLVIGHLRSAIQIQAASGFTVNSCS